ncbi:MAG: hypothetical protein IKZ82_11160 [Clostridia bacterium]|nr:hypothetical protein [Clostridia bacterium]
MRKLTIFILIAAMLAAVCLAGCSKKPNDVIIDVDPINTEETLTTANSSDSENTPADTTGATDPAAPSATPTAVPFVTPTPAVDPTALPTAATTPDSGVTDAPVTGIIVPTIPPTAAPTNVPGQVDYSVFNNCCFVGNSVFEGLHTYGVIKNGTWFTKVGLNILTVYNTPVIGGSVPIIDELNNGSYSGILLMFGQNECGWPDLNNFIRKYEQLLQDVWARQPQAKLFLMAITPVSKAVSDKGANGVTNTNINTINQGLEALAARTQNAYYVSVPQQFYNSNGSLVPEASSDGIHLTSTYMKIWADHICRVVSGVL